MVEEKRKKREFAFFTLFFTAMFTFAITSITGS